MKLFGLAASASYLPACATSLKRMIAMANIESISPIDRHTGATAPRVFSGDKPDRSHPIFWKKEAYIQAKGGHLPRPTQRVPLVIVGGGISGLFSAYLLRAHQPVLLESAPRFGGNSRGESWNGIDYSIGAAYFMNPEPGSPLQKLLEELGVDKLCRIKKDEDPIIYHDKRFNHFWEGDTDPANKLQFLKLKHYFQDVLKEQNGQEFPEIPILDQTHRSRINALDRISFQQHLEHVVGGKLHPHIHTALEHYCWS